MMHKTLIDAIDALDSEQHGFNFLSKASSEASINYVELRHAVQSLARKLNALKLPPGDPVIIAEPDQAQFILVFLSVIRAGLVAVPFHPPSLTGDLIRYRDELVRLKNIAGAHYIIAGEPLCKRLMTLDEIPGLTSVTNLHAYPEHGELPTVRSNDTALIQFTSGSTGSPKGVVLSHDNLVHNASAIQHSLAVDPSRDRGLSWLPLHHDMGLIGFLITPLLTQASNWFLAPWEFARYPRRWLELMSQTRATISYAPNFGYELAFRSAKQFDCRQWDLSEWRVAGCGGEPIVADVLKRFAERLQPAGFDPGAFVPSYGLAEATVAVSIAPLGAGASSCRSGTMPGRNTDSETAVTCGFPIRDTEVRIVSPEGTPLRSGLEGAIQVRGPGVARYFLHADGFQVATDSCGWLDTGDIGTFRANGLQISGRQKETLVINGRNFFSQDIEECLIGIENIRRGRIVAISRPRNGSEELVLIVEALKAVNGSGFRKLLRTAVRQQLGLSVADIVAVPKGTITRTSSGKLQRRALLGKYLSGELESPHLVSQ